MKTICGADCSTCPSQFHCGGCNATGGCPFGKSCFVYRYIQTGGMDAYETFVEGLIREINDLHIPGLPQITALVPLVGSYVNLSYPLPSGETVKLLRDDEIYLGTQVHSLFDDGRGRCFGVVAREHFLLICEYGENAADPELVAYIRR